MGTRTVAYKDGNEVFFRAIMDNALGLYLKAGLPDTSGKYNERVARNEGRIIGMLSGVKGLSSYQTFKKKTVKERVRRAIAPLSQQQMSQGFLAAKGGIYCDAQRAGWHLQVAEQGA